MTKPLIPAVDRDTLLLPAPTMTALTTYFTEQLPGASPEAIATAVESYLTENPIEGDFVTPAELTQAIEAIELTPGPEGAPGTEGASAYELAVASGFVGSESAWLASLVGEDGVQGEPGIDGADGAPGAPGVVRVVVITGDEPRPNSDFVIWLYGASRPTNMIEGDLWFHEPEVDPDTPPEITTTVLDAMTEGVAFAQTLEATNSPTSWSIESGAVAGLSIDNTGQLAGTPTTASDYTMVVRATNADGFDEQTYTGSVAPASSTPEGFSIFGDASPGPESTINNDGGGSLFVGNRFYTTEAGGIDVIGLRLWEPATADSTFLNLDITARAYADDWLGAYISDTLNAGAPLQTKTHTAPRVAGSWTEIIFDAPVHVAPISSGAGTPDLLTLAVGYANGQAYAVTPGLTGDAIDSVEEPGTYLAENGDIGRGINSVNGGQTSTTYYGIDLLFEVS